MVLKGKNWVLEIRTGHYRTVLWISQVLAALSLFALVVWPAHVPALLLPLSFVMVCSQFVISRMLGVKSIHQLEERSQLLADAREARQQTEQLFAMTDMLQSAESHEDAGEVLQATAMQLLPEFRGALYVFNSSRDRLDLATLWPRGEDSNPAEALVPSNCWALKRGKPHINDPHAGTLCCKHNGGILSTIEVPMIARGQVLGLLMLATDKPNGSQELRKISRMAHALADSMSLALSNIGLQEKLRTQSLRDPLTGLYNRRYMEDALERFLNIGERSGQSTSVIMIDLDNFKKLNDEHGHAKGDAVLRDVAGQLVGALRPSDVVSRYGGEELLVILPDCRLEDAAQKAEMLRARIESLGDTHGTQITASLGIAAVPETSSGQSDVVSMADAALYAAKKAGRNCVHLATTRDAKPITTPRLAAAN